LTRPVRLRVVEVTVNDKVALATIAEPIAQVTDELSVRVVLKVGVPAAGMPNASTAAEVVPVLLTVGVAPGARAVTVPTATVAAAPFDPVVPVVPVAPTAPCGMVKFNVAALEVPALLTVAADPAAPVVTVPTPIVAAVPEVPVVPVAPAAP
jgi:hypothetical protein